MAISHLTENQVAQSRITRRLPVRLKAVAASVVQRTNLRYFITVSGHPSAALLERTVPDFCDYFKFAFARDPYEHFASAYRYFNVAEGAIGMDEFIALGPLALQPQVNFVYKGSSLLVDYVGRVENIANDFRDVCQELGVEPVCLDRVNTTDHVARELLSEKACRHVRKTYTADFEAFGYAP